MKRSLKLIVPLLLAIFFFKNVYSQQNNSIPPIEDSTAFSRQLSELVVKAFDENKHILDQPAPVFTLPPASLSRYQNNSVLPALNTVPGVRMEERSPGSYRLNIRGSSLRSPFGVRNVKIYYNGIPITDPSGDTYLNQFSYNDFGSLEVIKGPASSIYGAGTGGALLISSPLIADTANDINSAEVNFNTGSYGMYKMNAAIRWGNKKARNRIAWSDEKSDGYRDHTNMHQQTFSWESLLKNTGKQQVDFFAHYSDLYYQTPGALTLEEYQADPKAARPASGSNPSSEESKAAVYQKTFIAGANIINHFTDHFDNTTVLYGSYTDFTNPTTRNYEFRKEPHFGGRTVFKYHSQIAASHIVLLAGTEMQQGYFSVKDHGNNEGNPDTLQTDYHVNNFQAIAFAQADISFVSGWDITAGASLNFASLEFLNLYPVPVNDFKRNYKNQLMPRIALLKKFNNISFYATVSAGFSPPTVSELLPSTSQINKTLQAERGTDYELGSRGSLFKGKLYYDINVFHFNLTQSISQRRDNSGADYFVNAGGRKQNGAEAYLNYQLIDHPVAFITTANIWLSQSWLRFRYKNYQVVEKDYSGNPVPGVAPYTLVSGVDINSRMGIAAHATFTHTDKIPLDDANAAFAKAYNLLGFRLGYRHRLNKILSLNIFCGVDNILNEKYSLGDDVNAFGGRYYNAAAARNYYGSIGLKANL